MEDEKAKPEAVLHRGKILCANCFNKMSEKERLGRTALTDHKHSNCKSGCSICKSDCYYFHIYNAEWDDC